MAIFGAPAAGWPTSMWLTWPPAASIRAAAAITSITMNGGTSLRREGASSASTRFLNVASCIYLLFRCRVRTRDPENGALAPQTGRIVRLIRAYPVFGLTPITKTHHKTAFQDRSMLFRLA